MADTSLWQRAQDLFQQVRERSADQRAELLDRVCADDAELRTEVESLLKHHDDAGVEFMRPLSPPPTLSPDLIPVVEPGSSQESDQLIGRDIGGCHIERLIAVGGMGTVYLAKQHQPHRQVAIKLIRAGIASKSALRRFEFESEILAHLRHPNIAEVYEAGTHVGLPYFVMEYIADARPIREYASAAGLSHRDRLRLFEQVCEAVQYGHQRGVIHRDLKPGNILVDADGRVQVIDFGVARATDADITLTTLHTAAGELVGTLQYMSPEQCDADLHEIDVRSDVYSLGVVLFELLTGTLPYDVSDTTIVRAARIICESPPVEPSTIDRRLRGDVEIIVLKSLHKDRERRYQSAADLLRDIRHYVNREPIEARPPTLWTRTLRWVARHPAWATTVTCLAIAAMVFAGTWISVWWLNSAPHRIVRYDAAGEVVTPLRVVLGVRAVEARLLARNSRVIHTWRTATGHIKVAELLERSREFGGGKIVMVGFAHAHEYEWGNSLAAFETRGDFEHPTWTITPTGGDLPPTKDNSAFDARVFNINTAYLVGDFFPGRNHPGMEIAVVHGHDTNSLRILRIYDLRGDSLYQVWQDGGIISMYWMADERLLVCYGQNGERRWDEWGWRGVSVPNPRVVFAIRPEPGQRNRGFLGTQPNGGLLDPVWYKCLFPPGLLQDSEQQPVVWLDTPKSAAIGRAVRLRIDLLDDRGVSGGAVEWDIDANGQEVELSRVVNDEYNTRLGGAQVERPHPLPDPSEIHTEPWPPRPPVTPQGASP